MNRAQLLIGLMLCALLALLPARHTLALEIAGELHGAVHWSGEVLLTGPVVVPAGARLDIAPGTRVRAATADSTLRIQGVLQVAGEAEAPVEFLTPHGWQGILVDRPQEPPRIRHARFSKAAVALSVQAAEMHLDQVVFRDCTTAIKALREAHLLVMGSRFERNQVGVDADLKSLVDVRDSVFTMHGEAGVRVTNGCRLNVFSSRFADNGAGIVLLQKISGEIRETRFVNNDRGLNCSRIGEGLLVRGNLFEQNRIALESGTFSQPLLSDNRFLGNGTAVKSDQFATGEFLHNLFEGNGTALQNTRRADPLVSHNVFSSNGVAVFCDFSSYPRIRDNNFLDNPLAVKLGSFQSAAGARPPGTQREAGFSGPAQPRAGADAPTQDFIDASSNWWGEDTAQLAAGGSGGNPSIFFDRKDQPEVELGDSEGGGVLDVVHFSPWLGAPVLDAGPR